MSKTNISLTVILLRFRILYNSKLTFGNKCCLCAGSTAHISLRVFKIFIYYGEMINSTWHERDGESLVWLTRIAIFLVQYTRLLRQQRLACFPIVDSAHHSKAVLLLHFSFSCKNVKRKVQGNSQLQVAANPWQKEEEERDTNQHTHPHAPHPPPLPPPPPKKKKKKKKSHEKHT